MQTMETSSPPVLPSDGVIQSIQRVLVTASMKENVEANSNPFQDSSPLLSVQRPLPVLATTGLLLVLIAFSGAHSGVSLFNHLKRRWAAWQYLFQGPSMIQKGYDEV